jgi:hypothetical protein
MLSVIFPPVLAKLECDSLDGKPYILLLQPVLRHIIGYSVKLDVSFPLACRRFLTEAKEDRRSHFPRSACVGPADTPGYFFLKLDKSS